MASPFTAFTRNAFRNLALLALVISATTLAQLNLATAQDKSAEVEVLFGTSGKLDKFRGYKEEAIGKGWKVDGDAIHFDGSGGGDLVTRDEYRNFDLNFEWKVDKGANSGVMYRVSLGDPAPYFSGPEYQILDDDLHGDGKNPFTSAGAIYAMYKPENKSLETPGGWNAGRIVLNGNHLEHWLNGVKVCETELDGEDWKARYGKSKFSKWEKFGRNPSGHIVFQDHGDKVWYRNITVKRLPDIAK